MTAGATRSRLLKDRLDRFVRTFDGVADGDVKSVHQSRVASRRLREVVPVLQLDHGTTRRLMRRLKRVTSRLGKVRELDVLLLLIDELHISRPKLSEALQQVSVAVARARKDARADLVAHLPGGEMRRIGHKLERAGETLREREKESTSRSWQWALEARVAHRGARLADALRDAGQVYLPERLHDVRIALKKLRYATELATSTGRHPAASLRILKTGQDILGRMHDLQVLIDRVREVQASMTRPKVAAWRALDALIIALENECRALHAQFLRHQPALTTLAAKLAKPAGAVSRRKAG